jgi:hypothetical protein
VLALLVLLLPERPDRRGRQHGNGGRAALGSRL